MSYLFNNWTPDAPFSAAVAKAKALGYTEPDPREDLNGKDVARKIIIAVRKEYDEDVGVIHHHHQSRLSRDA